MKVSIIRDFKIDSLMFTTGDILQVTVNRDFTEKFSFRVFEDTNTGALLLEGIDCQIIE